MNLFLRIFRPRKYWEYRAQLLRDTGMLYQAERVSMTSAAVTRRGAWVAYVDEDRDCLRDAVLRAEELNRTSEVQEYAMRRSALLR